jgi:protein TonB
MAAVRFHHSAALPWSPSPEEERRFRVAMAAAIGASLLLGALIPLLKPAQNAVQVEEIPPRFARLIVEQPPAPPALPKVEPKTEEPPAPKSKAEEARPQPKETKEAPHHPAVSPPSARELASKKGLLALSDELAGLHASSLMPELERQTLRPSSSAPKSADPATERSIITSEVASGSGGINVSRLSRDTGGIPLAGRETTRVEAPADNPGGRGAGSGAAHARPAGATAQRTLEEIQRVFDANRGALNTIYNRALRDDPSLAGKLILKITILPSGDISDLEIVSSELKDADLERKLLARIRLFKFGAKNVPVWTSTYPIDFFPG